MRVRALRVSDPEANSGGSATCPGRPPRAASAPSSRATAALSGASIPCCRAISATSPLR